MTAVTTYSDFRTQEEKLWEVIEEKWLDQILWSFFFNIEF